jgi:hypothetical protein
MACSVPGPLSSRSILLESLLALWACGDRHPPLRLGQGQTGRRRGRGRRCKRSRRFVRRATPPACARRRCSTSSCLTARPPPYTVCALARAHARTRAHTHAGTCAHACVRKHACAHTCTHAHTHMHACTYTHARMRTQAQRAHTRTHTRTHAHTHKHIH